MRFASSVQPAGQTLAGECRSTEITRAQAEVIAEALTEAGFEVNASRGTIEGADEPCDGVVFQDMTLMVVLWTQGAWVMGDLASGPSDDIVAALRTTWLLLEDRYGWVPAPPSDEDEGEDEDDPDEDGGRRR